MYIISHTSVSSLVPLLFMIGISSKISVTLPQGPIFSYHAWSHCRDNSCRIYETEMIFERAHSGAINTSSSGGRKESTREHLFTAPVLAMEGTDIDSLWVSLPSVSISSFVKPQQITTGTICYNAKAQWIICTEIHAEEVDCVSIHELPMSRSWFSRCAHY